MNKRQNLDIIGGEMKKREAERQRENGLVGAPL